MRKIFIFFTFIFLAIFSTSAFAIINTGHIYILAVAEDSNGNQTGSVADLYLEIKDGSGRIFLDTLPLTKVDTQFSTRFANQIACEYTGVDCKKYDFFYTIRSGSTIVGGPSAGAALTLLTISSLSDREIPDGLAITGTINAGGIIGPVGGVNAKIFAAEKEGLTKVIVPSIEIENMNSTNITNESTQDFYKNRSIEIIEASTIEDALYILYGERKDSLENLTVDKRFTDIMQKISNDLCYATEKLMVNGTNTTEEKTGDELYSRAKNASLIGEFYASASYCFGANVQFRRIDLKNKTQSDLRIIFTQIDNDLSSFEKQVEGREIKTIDDLQTYMIVEERIVEAKDYLDSVKSNRTANISSDNLAYTIERYNSALTWSKFFGTGKNEYKINKETIKEACIEKMSEVQNNLQYISLYIDIPLSNTNRLLETAAKHLATEEYALCIAEATQAKAESYLVLEALSISHDQMIKTLPEKLDAAKKNIIKAQSKQVFPILGYSYYEYAKSLSAYDKDSALIYSLYSIEMSNLDFYFEKTETSISAKVDYTRLILLASGYIIGVISTLFAFRKAIFLRKKGKRR